MTLVILKASAFGTAVFATLMVPLSLFHDNPNKAFISLLWLILAVCMYLIVHNMDNSPYFEKLVKDLEDKHKK